MNKLNRSTVLDRVSLFNTLPISRSKCMIFPTNLRDLEVMLKIFRLFKSEEQTSIIYLRHAAKPQPISDQNGQNLYHPISNQKLHVVVWYCNALIVNNIQGGLDLFARSRIVGVLLGHLTIASKLSTVLAFISYFDFKVISNLLKIPCTYHRKFIAKV